MGKTFNPSHSGVTLESLAYVTHLSLGAKFDTIVLTDKGPMSFVIHEELRYRTGSLLPQSNQAPSYAQLYIYDHNTAL